MFEFTIAKISTNRVLRLQSIHSYSCFSKHANSAIMSQLIDILRSDSVKFIYPCTIPYEILKPIRKVQQAHLAELVAKGERLTLEKYIEILESQTLTLCLHDDFEKLAPQVVYNEIMSKPPYLQHYYFKETLNPFEENSDILAQEYCDEDEVVDPCDCQDINDCFCI